MFFKGTTYKCPLINPTKKVLNLGNTSKNPRKLGKTQKKGRTREIQGRKVRLIEEDLNGGRSRELVYELILLYQY
jgi:hypothetical protein